MHLPTYLALLHSAENALAISYQSVARGYPRDADVHFTCHTFAAQCESRHAALTASLDRYAAHTGPEPDRLRPQPLAEPRGGPVGLLRDLQDLDQLAHLVESTWTITGQAAQGARDHDLIDLTARYEREITAQLAWLRMRMKAEAAQTLLVAP